jgi:hypothetical protein
MGFPALDNVIKEKVSSFSCPRLSFGKRPYFQTNSAMILTHVAEVAAVLRFKLNDTK